MRDDVPHGDEIELAGGLIPEEVGRLAVQAPHVTNVRTRFRDIDAFGCIAKHLGYREEVPRAAADIENSRRR
jgi:hypothetical protein